MKGPGRDYFTVNFEPYGFDDRIPLASNFPAGTNHPTPRYGGVLQPSIMFFDLYLGYDTGDLPANSYLQNIRLGLNINNILNRLPSAIDYDARASGGSPRIREGNEMQRTVTFSVTKVW